MSMKILLDAVVTATPSKCSTTIQFYTFVETVLAQRDDVFFYWVVPDWAFAEAQDWYPQHPNIEYILTKQHKDRMKEYLSISDHMEELLAFNGSHWDFDVVVTVRSGLAALYKLVMTSPRHKATPWMKEVWIIENMPMMKFKGSVATMGQPTTDMFTLNGHLAADRSVVMSYHEKGLMIKRAKEFFTPYWVKSLKDKMKEVIPAQFDTYELKSKKHYWKAGTNKKFCIAYAGRLTKSGTNLETVYRVMTNQWIMNGEDEVRLVVTTVSSGGKAQPPKYVELIKASRDEFWSMARKDMHVVIILHDEAGFLLTMMEPILLGTPVIVMDKPWSRGQLGDEYPFYVKNELEAYTLCKKFYDDYEPQYAKFAKWHKEWFKPTYIRRFKEDHLYTVLTGYMDKFEESLSVNIEEHLQGRKNNEIVRAIVDLVGDKDEFYILDVLKELADNGTLYSLSAKLKEDDREKRGLVWATPWNEFRVLLKQFYGWEDASIKLGHLKVKS